MNKSTTYLFPLINDILEIPNYVYEYFLENTFLFSDKYPDKDYYYILFKFDEKDEVFLKTEEKLTKLDIFIENIDIDDNKVLFVFEFPKSYLFEYNKLIEGKYSEYKMDAKTKILKYYNQYYNFESDNVLEFLTKLKHIFFKNKKLKEKIEQELQVTIDDNAELSSVINKEKETIKINVNASTS